MMSGISKKLFRQRQGLFSEAYHRGGKTPIARCEDKDKYNSLISIDQKGTRVIVNKGGTNERFVENNIQQASVIVYEDNVTIFERLLTNDADVMITDNIEVLVQMKLHPQLCGTMPDDNLTYSAKGYLINRDVIWLEYINAWLEQTRNNGTLEQIFKKYL